MESRRLFFVAQNQRLDTQKWRHVWSPRYIFQSMHFWYLSYPLGIQSPCQMMIGVYIPLFRKVFRFHYLSQKVIGSLGIYLKNKNTKHKSCDGFQELLKLQICPQKAHFRKQMVQCCCGRQKYRRIHWKGSVRFDLGALPLQYEGARFGQRVFLQVAQALSKWLATITSRCWETLLQIYQPLQVCSAIPGTGRRRIWRHSRCDPWSSCVWKIGEPPIWTLQQEGGFDSRPNLQPWYL